MTGPEQASKLPVPRLAPGSVDAEEDRPSIRTRLEFDRDSVERSLVTLVLTLVEMLRQLMERQAIRRVEQGSLNDEKIEQIGQTLMALDERMAELCDHFELDPEDLNIDLGPLGRLI